MRMADRVQFERAVPRSAIRGILASSEILAVPSVWPDPCPLVVLEALASGLPILAARSGGIPELGQNACLYHQPGDIDGLARQLELLLTDSRLRDDMAGRARRRAEELS